MAEKSPQQQFEDWMASQSGYIGKGKKADWWSDHTQGQENQKRLMGVFDTSKRGNFGIGGASRAEQTGRIEGLERAKVLTGQDPYQIGADYQQAYGNLKKRSTMSDTGSELLRANKAGAVAEARQSLQQQGVKGGAALGATSQIERAKSYDVNNQLMQNQKDAEQAYMNAVKANANFTTANEMNYGAMAMGKDIQAPASPSNGFGTVICTELYRQGLMDEATYKLDADYGKFMRSEYPDIYYGYRFLADPVVVLMKKSLLFTWAVSILALPWARNMAGNKNFLGAAVTFVGEPICFIVGKFLRRKSHAAN